MSYRYEDGVKIENSEEYLEERAAEAARNAPIIAALQENEIREQRNALLTASDWTQANDSPLTTEVKTSWATYRTALRNLPDHSNWPNLEDDDWPTKP
tara:strand:- start:96 stop:389 length:294 start_codon:yes stop_codon:yes gene_type:complete